MYVSPEELLTERFGQFLDQLTEQVGLGGIAVDEAIVFPSGAMSFVLSIGSCQFCPIATPSYQL